MSGHDHDHHHGHDDHARGRGGHSHAPVPFGTAFAIGTALNFAILLAPEFS